MTIHLVELFIKGTYLSMIECDDGSFYEEDCSEFTEIKLPDTENLDTEALTLFVQKNLPCRFHFYWPKRWSSSTSYF